MKRLVINGSIYFLISILVLFSLDKFYTSYYNAHKNVCQKSDWVFSLANQRFDIGFIGNSRTYNMVDVVGIEKVTGKKGINLGLTGGNFSEQYLVLDQFFKTNNQLGVLMLQVDMISMDYTKIPFNLHFPAYMHLFSDTTVSGVYKDNAPFIKYLIWKYIPFARYMEYSNRYVLYKTVKGGFECTSSPSFDSLRGTSYENIPFKDFNVYRYWTINKQDLTYLKRIIRLCDHYNCKVAFYTAPFYHRNRPYQLNVGAIQTFIQQMADSCKIPYFNFNNGHYLPSKDTVNFYDNNHMNEKGSVIFSKDLADSLNTCIFKL